MTENRRIFWNIIATYGRSLYGVVMASLPGRWAPMAPGTVAHRLMGLVGGLTVFIAFFNGILAGANARFYAISVGAASVAEEKEGALDECRHWFNTALSVHTLVPVVLIAIGYPLGTYAIEHWLTIPPDRMSACVWVFRFVCISCFIGMVNVPFTAMYNAKQYIAELSIYGFITSTLNAIFLYYMISHPGVWLAKYAAWTCFLSIVPQLVICVRAMIIFPECRVRIAYLWDGEYIKRLGVYSIWQLIGNLCGMLRTNGIAIVVNKFFGAGMNAAQNIGVSVQGHCQTLAGAMQGAFVPVITQACGAGDYEKMNRFVLRTCKFNVFLSMIFMLPLALELPEVMKLWLKEPPPFTTGLCHCAMILYWSSCPTVGHMVAVNAVGKVAGYYSVLGAVNVLVLPVAVCAGYLYRNVYVVMGVVIFFEILNSIGRVYFARCHAKSSARAWFRTVMMPMLVALVICVPIGLLPRLAFEATIGRLFLTTLLCETILLPTLWFVILNDEERKFMRERVFAKVLKRVCK